MPAIATLTMNPAVDVATSTDEVRPHDKLRCAAPAFDPGGGGINVARVVRTLGGEACAVFPSGGPAGEMLEQLLRGQGLPFRAVRIGGATRESFTVDEGRTGDQYRFVLPGPELSPPERRRCLDRLCDLPERPRFVVASGSLPPGVPDDFYREVAECCAGIGAELVLDTSGEALRRAAGGPVFLMKPNLREAEQLLGRAIEDEAGEEEAARELVARGLCRAAVVSLGPRGAVAADAEGAERFPPIAVPVRSAVGAGDSMVAGIVLGLSRGLAFREAVRLGLAAGAAALATPETQLARREDVERLYGKPLPGPTASSAG